MENEKETTGTEQGQTADRQDAFLEGWESEGTPALTEADQRENGTEDNQRQEAESAAQAEKAEDGGAEADGSSEETAESGKEAAAENTAADAESGWSTESWNIKHMGRERTLKVSDITPQLLQKGLDYDRIREKYDEAKPVIEMLTEFAKNAGMSTQDYARFLRIEAKKTGGASEDDARRAVELEDREAAVAIKEAAQQEEKKKKEEGETRVKSDLAEFERAFPDVFEKAKTDPKAIPDSVWNEVASGFSLTAAYSRYAVDRAGAEAREANARAEAAVKNSKNAVRSTGSMKSAGNDCAGKDPFLEGFGD